MHFLIQHSLEGKNWIILHLKCLTCHPECETNAGSLWAGTSVFTQALTLAGRSQPFWTARTVAVTSSAFWSSKKVFNPVSLGPESSSARTQRMAFSAAILLALTSHNSVFNVPPFPFKKTFCYVLWALNAAQVSQWGAQTDVCVERWGGWDLLTFITPTEKFSPFKLDLSSWHHLIFFLCCGFMAYVTSCILWKLEGCDWSGTKVSSVTSLSCVTKTCYDFIIFSYGHREHLQHVEEKCISSAVTVRPTADSYVLPAFTNGRQSWSVNCLHYRNWWFHVLCRCCSDSLSVRPSVILKPSDVLVVETWLVSSFVWGFCFELQSLEQICSWTCVEL